MDKKPEFVAAWHAYVRDGAIHVQGERKYLWRIPEKLRDVELQKGDVIKVATIHGIPYAVVADLPEHAVVLPEKNMLGKVENRMPIYMPGEPGHLPSRPRAKHGKRGGCKKKKKEAAQTIDGNRFYAALAKKSIKYGKVARKVGVTRRDIERYATGEDVPTLEVLRKLAAVLDVTPQWLAGNK